MRVKIKQGTEQYGKYWPMLVMNKVYEACPYIDETLDCFYRIKVEGMTVDKSDVEFVDEE